MEINEFLSINETQKKINDYKKWKESNLNDSGWFPIFNDFKETNLLKEISGNALKLYIYLGIHSKNETGISWHSLETIGKYFGRSPRTISNWMEELKKVGLIKRFQPDKSSSAVTFLRPYQKEEEKK